MPVLNGFDVMAQLKRDNPTDYLPILVLSADQSKDTQVLALAGGAKDFISKPFVRIEVLMRVQNILEVRLMYNQINQHNERLEVEVSLRTKQL